MFSGLGATSGIAAGYSLVPAGKAREGQLLFADREISVVEYLGNDVVPLWNSNWIRFGLPSFTS